MLSKELVSIQIMRYGRTTDLTIYSMNPCLLDIGLHLGATFFMKRCEKTLYDDHYLMALQSGGNAPNDSSFLWHYLLLGDMYGFKNLKNRCIALLTKLPCKAIIQQRQLFPDVFSEGLVQEVLLAKA